MTSHSQHCLLACPSLPPGKVAGGGEGSGARGGREGEVACPFIVLLFEILKVLK